jgi:hypothetical protein
MRSRYGNWSDAMQVKTKRRRLGAQAWREMVGRFTRSGLSAEVFSQRERVSLASLKRWQQELDRSEAVPASPGGFVELGSLRSAGSRFEVRLDLGDGVLLTLSRG